MSHETRATWRSAPGFNARQWRVSCTCGYAREAASKPHAETLVREHAAEHDTPLEQAVREVIAELHCTCWHADECEFDLTPCPKCRLVAALERAA